MMRRVRSAFTLVELLVVIAIIGILAGLLLPALAKARLAAKIAGAKATIQNLALACQSYHQDNGDYPLDDCKTYTSDVTPTGTMTFICQLVTQGVNKPYFDAKEKDRSPAGLVASNTYFLDPFKTPYVYTVAPQRKSIVGGAPGNNYNDFPGNAGGLNIWSLGPNRACESCSTPSAGNMPLGGSHTTGALNAPYAAPPDAACQHHCGGGKVGASDDITNW